MASVATETFTSTSAPIQYAAVTAFEEGPEIERYLWHSRRILKALGWRLAARLRDAGADCLDPDGGLYLFPDFSRIADRLQKDGITTSVEMCSKLLEETGVAVLPGSEFGQPLEELTMRVAYVDFDGAAALRTSEEITLDHPLPDDFVLTLCGRVIEAVDRMCEWVNR
jgi:aspartate aminotransferase